MFRTALAAFAAAFLAFAPPSSAHEIKLGDLALTDLWTRATPPNAQTAGGYLTVANNGSAADRLVAASSPLAASGELHQMTVNDGVMTMRPVAGGIEIPSGGTLKLEPGGYHLMFIAPKERLAEGEKFPVTLTFERAGKVETFLHVMAMGARAPEGDHKHSEANP